MPIKISDLYDRIVRDELPSSAPRSLDELRNYTKLANGIFQREISGKYFLRYKGRTLMVIEAGMDRVTADYFCPPEDLGFYSFGNSDFDARSLLEEKELTPVELEDLRKFRERLAQRRPKCTEAGERLREPSQEDVAHVLRAIEETEPADLSKVTGDSV